AVAVRLNVTPAAGVTLAGAGTIALNGTGAVAARAAPAGAIAAVAATVTRTRVRAWNTRLTAMAASGGGDAAINKAAYLTKAESALYDSPSGCYCSTCGGTAHRRGGDAQPAGGRGTGGGPPRRHGVGRPRPHRGAGHGPAHHP